MVASLGAVGAAQAAPTTVVNPLTGQTETVVEELQPGIVFTDQGNAIVLLEDVDDEIVLDGVTYKVTSVTDDPTTNAADVVRTRKHQR